MRRRVARQDQKFSAVCIYADTGSFKPARSRQFRNVDDTNAAVVPILSVWTDQPCRTRSEIGIPSGAIRFKTRHFTSASTCWFAKEPAASPSMAHESESTVRRSRSRMRSSTATSWGWISRSRRCELGAPEGTRASAWRRFLSTCASVESSESCARIWKRSRDQECCRIRSCPIGERSVRKRGIPFQEVLQFAPVRRR